MNEEYTYRMFFEELFGLTVDKGAVTNNTLLVYSVAPRSLFSIASRILGFIGLTSLMFIGLASSTLVPFAWTFCATYKLWVLVRWPIYAVLALAFYICYHLDSIFVGNLGFRPSLVHVIGLAFFIALFFPYHVPLAFLCFGLAYVQFLWAKF